MSESPVEDDFYDDLEDLQPDTRAVDAAEKIERFLDDKDLDTDEVLIAMNYSNSDGTPILNYSIEAKKEVAEHMDGYPSKMGKIPILGTTTEIFRDEFLEHWDEYLLKDAFAEADVLYHSEI